MSTPELLRVAVIGATGTVGRELIALLQERRFPIQRLVPVASEGSIGQEVEFLGHDLAVETEPPPLAELDLLWLCTPAAAAVDWIRLALRSELACVDLAGALAERGEIPLGLAASPSRAWSPEQPLIAGPAGPVLLLAPVLSALAERAGLARAQATILESASSAGRAGVEALQEETLGLFQQQEVDVSEVFSKPLAFDCFPSADAPGAGLTGDREAQIESHLARLLSEPAPLGVTALRVPTFAGCGIQLSVETQRPLSAQEAAETLSKAPGIVVSDEGDAPSTRGTIGSADVGVGRIRPDPSVPEGHGLRLWLAGDPVRLAAINGLELARQRFFRTGR
ncbi:MAG: hypothetical protein JRG95_02360 [Deltaproteobacteria bacterium]|nr:hypothetical protein [Deltaproteobacteria bacterium]